MDRLWELATFQIGTPLQVLCMPSMAMAFIFQMDKYTPSTLYVELHGSFDICKVLWPLYESLQAIFGDQHAPSVPGSPAKGTQLSRTWFHSGVDLTYVPNAKLARQALKMELPADRIRTIGLPTRPQFWDPWIPTKLSARNTMGLSPSAHNILVVGGGEGLGPISDVAWELAKEIEKRNKTTEKKNDVLLGGKQNVALPPIELVIICGKNKGVKESLQRMKWPPDVYVTVYGFTSKLDVLMAAADVMITKAGPGTIAEACIKGLPLIISSYIPGQEYGNVEFSVSHGFAVYCTKPKEISVTVMDLLKDPVRLQAMSKAARASAQPNAALSIAEDIVKTVLPSVYNQHT
eukprot:441335_1